MQIRFGTDGWRGVISRDFTFDNVRRVAAAIAAYLEREAAPRAGVAVGYDRRFLSDRYAAEVAGVLAARDVAVHLSATCLPTPVLSWAVKHQGLAGGIMVTASHNPYEWNGLKFKEPFGGSARSAVNRAVETILQEEIGPGDAIPCLPLDRARRRGLVSELQPWESYRAGVRRLIDFEVIRAAGLRVAVDSMHGCASPWLADLLREAGCRVTELRTDWNPGFGGGAPEPVSGNLRTLEDQVASGEADLGLANDGDGDRIGAVDERGRYFSPQRILAVFLRYLREVKKLPGDVAKAVSGTSMLDLLAERYGLESLLTPIGFKHVGELMLERDIVVGGEESGGIGISAHLPERDGLLNALLLTEIVARTGKGLRANVQEIFDDIGYFTYDRIDLHLDGPAMDRVREQLPGLHGLDTLAGLPVREVFTFDGTKFLRDDASWLLIRPSGTEPALRIYAEARSRAEVEALLAEGRHLMGL